MRPHVFVLVIVTITGCVRDPEQAICPDLRSGDLVVTEIRAPQEDQLGAWVELYNASGASIDLAGLTLRFRKKDGSSETDVLVRRSVTAAAGSYTVLGLFDDSDDMRPAYVDYGFATDFQGVTWLLSAALDIDSCGELVDRATYDSLPDQGTYSLGIQPPTADGNDFPAAWCTDSTDINAAFPGTPQHANIACP